MNPIKIPLLRLVNGLNDPILALLGDTMIKFDDWNAKNGSTNCGTNAKSLPKSTAQPVKMLARNSILIKTKHFDRTVAKEK